MLPILFAVAQIWYAAPLVVSISLVYAATRHEQVGPILQHAFRLGVWIAGFMGVVFAVLFLLSLGAAEAHNRERSAALLLFLDVQRVLAQAGRILAQLELLAPRLSADRVVVVPRLFADEEDRFDFFLALGHPIGS